MKVAKPIPLYSPITLHQVTGHNKTKQARSIKINKTKQTCSVNSFIQLLYIYLAMEFISIVFNNIHELTERFDLFLTFISSVNHCDSTPKSSLRLDTPLFREPTFPS